MSEIITKIPPAPLVSVGLPVYNEGRFAARAIASLLAQDFEDFELIISDNGSTDDTRKICERAAESDPRIRFSAFSENRGIAANFTHVLGLARGKYFMWASGHDLWGKTLLGGCVKLLESHDDAAIAFGPTVWIDHEGYALKKEYGFTDTRGMDILARYFTVLLGNVHPVLGLMRTKYINEIPKIAACPGSDLVFLTVLAMKGDFLCAPEGVCYRREARKYEAPAERMKRYTSLEFNLDRTILTRIFPLFRLPVELFKAVVSAAIPTRIKIAICAGLLGAIPLRYLAGKRENLARMKIAGERLDPPVIPFP